MATYTESFTALDGSLPATDTDLTWARTDGGGGAGWSVTGNQASPNGATRGINMQSRAEHDTASSDQYAQLVITGLAGAASECGPAIRYASAANTFYLAMFRNAAVPWVQIWKCVAGTFTALGAQITVVVLLPDTLRIEVEGSTIRAYWNGSLTESITDTSIASGTRAGLHGHENSGQGLGVVVDSFEFGDLSAAPSASGGSTSIVTVTGSGAGTTSHASGSTATVPVISSGAGSPGHSGGSSAAVATVTTGAGAKQAGGGTITVIAVVTTGGGEGASNPGTASGGSTATLLVTADGAGMSARSGGAGPGITIVAAGGGINISGGRPLVLFPDVEAWAVDYIATQLAVRTEPYTVGAYVSNTVPAPRLDRMIIVRRDGGPRLDIVRETSRLAVRVWALNDADAADLTAMVRAILAASLNEGPVRRYTDTGPVSVPEQSPHIVRFFTAELITRA